MYSSQISKEKKANVPDTNEIADKLENTRLEYKECNSEEAQSDNIQNRSETNLATEGDKKKKSSVISKLLSFGK